MVYRLAHCEDCILFELKRYGCGSCIYVDHMYRRDPVCCDNFIVKKHLLPTIYIERGVVMIDVEMEIIINHTLNILDKYFR